jgi:hypothetical protein
MAWKAASEVAIDRLRSSHELPRRVRMRFTFIDLQKTVTASQFFYFYLLPTVAGFVILAKVVVSS